MTIEISTQLRIQHKKMIATGLKSKSKMTYQELLHQLQSLNEEQLQQDVTVCDENDEYFKVNTIHYANEAFNDVLDHGHPYLTFNSIALY